MQHRSRWALAVLCLLGFTVLGAFAHAHVTAGDPALDAPQRVGQGLGFLLLVGTAGASAMVLTRRRAAGTLLPVVLLGTLLLAPLAVPEAAAQGDEPGRYGYFVPSATSDGMVRVPMFGATVCVAAPEAEGDVVFDVRDRDGQDRAPFEVPGDQLRCQAFDDPVDLVLTDAAGASAVRVLVLQDEPERMRTPGVQILAGAGDAVAVPRLSADGSLSLRTGDTFVDVGAFDGRTLERLDEVSSIVQTARLLPDQDVDNEVWVVQLTGATDGQVRLLWEDDDWVRPEPTIGDILAVVAVALLVTLYRGGKHRPGRPEQAASPPAEPRSS